MMALLFVLMISLDCLAQTKKTSETREALLTTVAKDEANANWRSRFISYGPSAVPLITKELLQLLREGASDEAVREPAFSLMPLLDQKRAKQQAALIELQGIALNNMTLEFKMRDAAKNSIYQALQSPYEFARLTAISVATYAIGREAEDHIIPLLNDSEQSNRVVVAQMLSLIGDSRTADKMEEVLKRRREELTAKQIAEDWSLADAAQAIKELRSKKR